MTTYQPKIVLELLSWIDSLPGEISCHEILPARTPRMGAWPNLSASIIEVLNCKGTEHPYAYQSEAIDLALSGKSVMIQTPFSLRKSKCYDIIVIDTLLKNPDARALYLSPSPSASQNHLENLKNLAVGVSLDAEVYTMDLTTSSVDRDIIRDQARAVISNVETLHSLLLPKHTNWSDFFTNLRYVIIDEIHLYRGIPGSHLANILRRLKRICSHYGSQPVFLCKSPEIANPLEHAENLTGEKMHLVVDDSSPVGKHHYLVYNSPMLDTRLNIRRVPILETALIAGEALANDIGTVVFAQSQTNVETLTPILTMNLSNRGHKTDPIVGYSEKYDVHCFTEIQEGIDQEEIRGIITTNGLELNADYSSLDLAILHGLPDSIATAKQQMSVVRDETNMSVGVLIASALPFDQFFASHPGEFIKNSTEKAMIYADNPYILLAHLACAAQELPLVPQERFGQKQIETIEQELREAGLIVTFQPHNAKSKAASIFLGSASDDYFVILDITESEKPIVIGHIDKLAAPSLLYPQAIYFQAGQSYEVLDLDYSQMRCLVKRIAGDYYTKAYRIVHTTRQDEMGRGEFSTWGKVRLTICLRSFKKIKTVSHENLGYGYIVLPEEQMNTLACWIQLRNDSQWHQWEETRQNTALTGFATIINGVLPLFLMCNRHDTLVLGRIRRQEHPGIAIVDNVPGGIGYAQKTCEMDRVILETAYEGLTQCNCEEGCLACVGHEKSSIQLKESVRILLSELLDKW